MLHFNQAAQPFNHALVSIEAVDFAGDASYSLLRHFSQNYFLTHANAHSYSVQSSAPVAICERPHAVFTGRKEVFYTELTAARAADYTIIAVYSNGLRYSVWAWNAIEAAPTGVPLQAIPAAAERPAFVEAFPHLRESHRAAQAEMFTAATARGLNTNNREGMIAAICEYLQISITSRRQLTILEMQLLTLHIESGGLVWRAHQPRRIELRRAA